MSHSALTKLLSSNDIPKPAEAVPIRRKLGDTTHEIDELKARLAQLEGRARGYRAILSPVRALSVDILRDIFLLSAPKVLDHEGREELLRLGLVCKLWNEAMVSTKKLWVGSVTIKASDIEVAGSDTATIYQRTVPWFERAGQYLKKLDFIADQGKCRCLPFDSAGYDNCITASSPLVHLLVHGPQLDHFTLRCEFTRCHRNFRAAVQVASEVGSTRACWDGIQSFDLRILHASEKLSICSFPKTFFANLPSKVTRLSLGLPPTNTFAGFWGGERAPARVDYVDQSFHIPHRALEGLTEFAVSCDWGSAHVLDALLSCTRKLETLSIDANIPSVVWDEGAEADLMGLGLLPVTLPKLCTLRHRDIQECSRRILEGLLQLEYLTLDRLDFSELDQLLSWSDLIPRFYQWLPSLRRLELLHVPHTFPFRRAAKGSMGGSARDFHLVTSYIPAPDPLAAIEDLTENPEGSCELEISEVVEDMVAEENSGWLLQVFT